MSLRADGHKGFELLFCIAVQIYTIPACYFYMTFIWSHGKEYNCCFSASLETGRSERFCFQHHPWNDLLSLAPVPCEKLMRELIISFSRNSFSFLPCFIPRNVKNMLHTFSGLNKWKAFHRSCLSARRKLPGFIP